MVLKQGGTSSLPRSPATLRPTLISGQALLTRSPALILFPRESHYIGGERDTAEGRSREVCITAYLKNETKS